MLKIYFLKIKKYIILIHFQINKNKKQYLLLSQIPLNH
jgi:hypothetical protein